MTGEIFLKLLQDKIDPMLNGIIEKNEHYLEDLLVFKHMNLFHTMLFLVLYQRIPGQWIERRGSVEWPHGCQICSRKIYFSEMFSPLSHQNNKTKTVDMMIQLFRLTFDTMKGEKEILVFCCNTWHSNVEYMNYKRFILTFT